MEAPPPLHVALFSTTGKGHLIPLVEFARKLLHLHAVTVTVTVILPDDGSPLQPLKDFFQSLPGINPVFLPTLSFHDLPENAPIESRIVLSVVRSLPALRKVLLELNESAPLSAFVGNLFAAFSFETVKELGIPVYMLYSSGAFPISFAFRLPELHVSSTCEYRHLPKPLKLPGCVPLNGSDFVDPVQDRGSQEYELILELCRKITVAEGILVNSFLELEPETFQALAGLSNNFPPVYPVGPLVRPVSSDRAECLDWLDKQPDGSVLYVAFGSGGTLSGLQLKELAMGLERSGQRFLLVARKPNDVIRNGAFFSGGEHKSGPGESVLPPGFLQRVKGKGFVLADWAPQVEVLSHPAVSGFVTHCGWNSTVESIVHGVPLIAWPLFAEQRMNAVLLSEGVKVAERVREDENCVVQADQIARMVRRLMEGEEGAEMRRRVKELKEAGERANGDGGSSTKALASVAEKWKRG